MNNETTSNRVIKCVIVWMFGYFGVHKFIEHKYFTGFIYIFTGGIFGFGYLFDSVLSIINIFSPLDYFESADKINVDDVEVTTFNTYKGNSEEYPKEEPVINKYDDFNYINPRDLDIALKAADGYPDSYVVLNITSTGFDASTCRIIEISAIKYLDGHQDSNFYSLINPGEILKKSVIEESGITDKDLMGAPAIEEVIPELFNFIGEYPIVGHNIGFDIRMLRAECLRNNLSMIENPSIDTITLARRLWDLDSYKLETIRHYLGMSLKESKSTTNCDVINRIYQIFKENQTNY